MHRSRARLSKSSQVAGMATFAVSGRGPASAPRSRAASSAGSATSGSEVCLARFDGLGRPPALTVARAILRSCRQGLRTEGCVLCLRSASLRMYMRSAFSLLISGECRACLREKRRECLASGGKPRHAPLTASICHRGGWRSTSTAKKQTGGSTGAGAPRARNWSPR